ncbi:MAG: hypothetical protein Q4G26_09885 [Paracoccus sp. (in: a-proteobacteria)]|nr:hypothetical protein [Paracoccus sp. (in: a-proteobacteria)]
MDVGVRGVAFVLIMRSRLSAFSAKRNGKIGMICGSQKAVKPSVSAV